MASTENQSTKQKQDEPRRQRSIFELPPDFFDFCCLLHSPSASLSDYTSKLSLQAPEDVVEETTLEEKINDVDVEVSSSNQKNNISNVIQRWSCNTCKMEFESLQDQRSHFKSDFHRFNNKAMYVERDGSLIQVLQNGTYLSPSAHGHLLIFQQDNIIYTETPFHINSITLFYQIKLIVAGKKIIKEEDFDDMSDSLNKDYDISSISGSEDENEGETGHFDDRKHGYGGISKNKLFVQLQTGEKFSVWKCLLLDVTTSISFVEDKSTAMDGGADMQYLTKGKVLGKLKSIIHEPRDKTHLRVVLLAKGGHFAGCVFDGTTVVAHKTFHRYVVRAKAGKKQSSKDASGGGIHSAGASLRRYNELALKKDVQELLTAWKPYFSVSSCIFLHAPSNNRQLFFEGEKPYFICQSHAIRNIPLTIRRPTFKEAKRIYSLLTEISPEISEETPVNTKEDVSSSATVESSSYPDSSGTALRECLETGNEACSSVGKPDNLSVSSDDEMDGDLIVGTSTTLHEAAKSGNAQKVLELLEQGLDPCIKDERGRTPYMLANEKEVRNTFRRFMASSVDKWDWHAAKVPGALTREMEEAQAAKQAEKDARRKAKAKERKKLRRAKEKRAQAEPEPTPVSSHKEHPKSSGSAISKEEEQKRVQDAEREKRAAAAERRIAALRDQDTGPIAASSNTQSSDKVGSQILCSCCHVSLSGIVPFHRYNYKYCSSSCMHVHRKILEDDE